MTDLKKCIIVDAAVLVAYALVANPAMTGIPVHEWLGIGVFLVIAVHTAMHFDWVVETARSAAAHRGMRLAKFVLDVLLVMALAVCVVSGAMVSGTVLAAFGLYADGYYFWDPLHAASAKLLLALLCVHIAFNWKLIVAAWRKRP